jgi:hypothetical protein
MLAVAFVLSVGFSSSALCQEDEPAAKDDAQRLPPYFKDVANESQKAKIRTIQADFDKQSAGLEAKYKELSEELKTLRTQIDGIKDKERLAVEAVLTPQQVAQIKKLRAAAQSRLAQELLKAAEEAAKRAEELTATE